jgi:preprotein translocase subunit SecE
MATITTRQKQKLSYFRSVQDELKKVTWTSRKELLLCTKAVIIATFVFGFAIYFVDLALRGILDGIGSIVRMMFG